MEWELNTTILAVWRIIVGISLIPAFGTLYQRLTLPEATRYEASKRLHEEEAALDDLSKAAQPDADKAKAEEVTKDGVKVEEKGDEKVTPDSSEEDITEVAVKKAHFSGESVRESVRMAIDIHSKEFIKYFSEWRHAKLLVGTCMCWFLLDIACVDVP